MKLRLFRLLPPLVIRIGALVIRIIRTCKWKALFLLIEHRQYGPSYELPSYSQARLNLLSIRTKQKSRIRIIGTDTPMRFDTRCRVDVSIIVPVYNASATIGECLDSLIGQRTHYTYEIVCINDGSTDDSLAVLNRYQTDSVRIISKANGGLSSARNAGIEASQGEYLLFVDSDDYLPPDSIELMVENALKTKADIVQGSVSKCVNHSKIYLTTWCPSTVETGLLDAVNASRLGTAWGKLYKRALWEDVRFPEGYAFEDAIIWCNIFPRCAAISFIKEPTYIFRSSADSLFKRQCHSNESIDALWILEECIKAVDMSSLDAGWYQLMLWQLSFGVISRIQASGKDDMAFRAAFVIAGEYVMSMPFFKCVEFSGPNARIYSMLEDSFLHSSYDEWIDCGKVLSFAGAV